MVDTRGYFHKQRATISWSKSAIVLYWQIQWHNSPHSYEYHSMSIRASIHHSSWRVCTYDHQHLWIVQLANARLTGLRNEQQEATLRLFRLLRPTRALEYWR